MWEGPYIVKSVSCSRLQILTGRKIILNQVLDVVQLLFDMRVGLKDIDAVLLDHPALTARRHRPGKDLFFQKLGRLDQELGQRQLKVQRASCVLQFGGDGVVVLQRTDLGVAGEDLELSNGHAQPADLTGNVVEENVEQHHRYV